MPSEFDLIRQYFTRPTPSALLGVGDDAALLQVSPGMELAVSVDMLVEGRHFAPQDGPGTVGHKSLAVNLSDMAAMGAKPRWATLALALPAADEKWLRGFAGGFFGLAGKFGVDLVGGDTTRGPLNICIQIMGEVPAGQALRRDGAKVGDEIWVSGALGTAALALAFRQGRVELEQMEAAACLPALYVPQPRVELGLSLRGIASAAIDVSDGLLADLGHILEQSGVGAEIHFEALPLHDVTRRHIGSLSPGSLPRAGERDADSLREAQVIVAKNCVLAGGDDYELCFAAPAARHAELLALAQKLALPLTCIGRIVSEAGLALLDGKGSLMPVAAKGFDHFA
ncbi:MAG: thiamine-phosphate kinase [Gammaproteobacteria bacterium]|nr:thiamine-phosphate kinase [Gammaproteobacteria bacterium]MBU1733515.1 thiamine-phosphate kinase [Gammaproteobacteria bacterium]MBU1893159.1 thiamine-phosphate kinase [Gammaproteobacteria bacterium]